jgi:hypothetical protein
MRDEEFHAQLFEAVQGAVTAADLDALVRTFADALAWRLDLAYAPFVRAATEGWLDVIDRAYGRPPRRAVREIVRAPSQASEATPR